jgi:hypothetical protein
MHKIKSIIFSVALFMAGLTTFSQVSETVNLPAAGTLKTSSFSEDSMSAGF